MRRRTLLAGSTLLALGVVGCGPRILFTAKPMLLDDKVHCEVTGAFTRGDRIFVEAHITNDNKKRTVRVNADAWAIKLPTGELVGKRVFARESDFIVLGPGQSRRIDVDFRQEGYDFKGLTEMRLVVGGIAMGQSDTEYVVGEVQLTRAPDETPPK